MKKVNRIAVFGSAFNPPHNGHADVIRQAAQLFDEVWVVPSYCHAFGKPMIDFKTRLEMTHALVEIANIDGNVNILDIESELAADSSDPVYTYDLLSALHKKHPNTVLTFVVGPDNAHPDMWRKFYKGDEILKRWNLWVAAERISIRSSYIRNRLNNGEHIDEKLLPSTIKDMCSNLYETG